MAQCPRCKEDMPLLSKVCPVCGYVVQDEKNTPTAVEFVSTLALFLHDIKLIPQPSFFKSMGQLSFIMLPIIAIYLLAMALVSEAGLFWILFALFFILAIWVIIKKAKGTLGNEVFNSTFKRLKADYEYNEQIAKMHLGKNKEVAMLMNDISVQISEIERQRDVRNRKNLFVWIVIIVIFCGLASVGVFSTNKVLNENKKSASVTASVIEAEGWEKGVQAFKASPEANDEYACNQYAAKILSIILDAGNVAAAEEFFLEVCMGKVDDYKCAKLVLDYYIDKKADREAARIFVAKCNGMRYDSDRKKLENLIKD